MFMGDRERAADLRADLGHLARVERTVAADAALQVGAAQILHDDVVGVAIATPVVDAHDIRAGQTGGRLRLLFEARCEGGVAGILRQHELDRHGAVQALVLRPVHHGHAARAHLVLEEVPASQKALFVCHLH